VVFGSALLLIVVVVGGVDVDFVVEKLVRHLWKVDRSKSMGYSLTWWTEPTMYSIWGPKFSSVWERDWRSASVMNSVSSPTRRVMRSA